MRLKLVGLICVAFIAAGCGTHQSTLQGPPNSGPQVRQNNQAPVQWRQFSCGGTCTTYPTIIAVGNNLWYTSYSGTSLIRMTMTGGTTNFPLLSSMNPTGLTLGSDGKLYVGSGALAFIDVMTTTGSVTQKKIPSGDFVSYYGGMTLGSDKNVWFVERAHIGRMTTAGTITEFTYNDANTTNYYGAITLGPDSNLWVTEYNTQKIDKIDTTGTQIAQYSLGCTPQGGVVSAGGFLWVDCGASLAQVTATGPGAGTVNLLFTGSGITQSGTAIAVGPDGNPWFGMSSDNTVGEFNIANNSFTFYYPPSTFATDYAMTAGPDGNVWALDTSNNVNVYILNVISASPATLTFATPTSPTQSFVVTELGTAAWTATSNHTTIATVAPGVPANTFVVTPKGVGTTKIIVTDAKGNSFAVLVTVL
jgi:streptogramin lyase